MRHLATRGLSRHRSPAGADTSRAGLPSDYFDRAADVLADLLPHARRRTLDGPDRVVDPHILVPLLLRFFSGAH
ncbi:hypothetical protein [Actinotalea caeni]|uniref:hypothetical protein n=1 Tax=Actinotalea caeni TaxID=1348467 RepID=UPI001877C327|nr:hypothetical protein [Actinotalea caeni]